MECDSQLKGEVVVHLSPLPMGKPELKSGKLVVPPMGSVVIVTDPLTWELNGIVYSSDMPGLALRMIKVGE